MAKETLVLAIKGGAANWSPERWKSRFSETCSDRRVVMPAYFSVVQQWVLTHVATRN